MILGPIWGLFISIVELILFLDYLNAYENNLFQRQWHQGYLGQGFR